MKIQAGKLYEPSRLRRLDDKLWGVLVDLETYETDDGIGYVDSDEFLLALQETTLDSFEKINPSTRKTFGKDPGFLFLVNERRIWVIKSWCETLIEI